MGDVTETRKYCKLTQEALDRSVRIRFGRGWGSVVRDTTWWWWWW